MASAGMLAQAGSASGGVAINLTVVSQNNCKFVTRPPAVMDFGTLDMASTTAISLSAGARFECKGKENTAIYAVTVGNGLHYDGSMRRMQHTLDPASFLKYTAEVSPATGTVDKKDFVDFTVTATIPTASFQQAVAGRYSDTITITVQP